MFSINIFWMVLPCSLPLMKGDEVVGSCGQGFESFVQKQGKLMVLAVQHSEYQCPQVELEVWPGSRLLH